MIPLPGRWHALSPGSVGALHPRRPWLARYLRPHNTLVCLDLDTGNETLLREAAPLQPSSLAWVGDHLAVYVPFDTPSLTVLDGAGNGALLHQPLSRVLHHRGFVDNLASVDLWTPGVDTRWTGHALVAHGDSVECRGPWRIKSSERPTLDADLARVAVFRADRGDGASCIELLDGTHRTRHVLPRAWARNGATLHWVGPRTLLLVLGFPRLDLVRLSLDGPTLVEGACASEDSEHPSLLRLSPDHARLCVQLRSFVRTSAWTRLCVVNVADATLTLQTVIEAEVDVEHTVHWLDAVTLAVWVSPRMPAKGVEHLRVLDTVTLRETRYAVPEVGLRAPASFLGTTDGRAVFVQNAPTQRVFLSERLVADE